MKRLWLSFIFALSAVGCKGPDYQQLRLDATQKYFATVAQRSLPADKLLALPECIQIALQNNLDLLVSRQLEKISKRKNVGAYLALLPDLTVSYTGTKRDNEPGASSESLESGRQSLEPSKSIEKAVGTFKMEVMLSLLDFGLAYYNARQADDKLLLAREVTRRTAQRLAFDVARAYCSVAMAQYLVDSTAQLLGLNAAMLKNLDELARFKTISPLQALDSRIQILQLNQQLQAYQREYAQSRVRLVSLMGYSPSQANRLKVDISFLGHAPNFKLPPIQTLEHLALENRPELYEMDINVHLALLETRKALVQMFPNVQIFTDFTNSSNKYLYNQSWWEIGLRAAYNLLKLPGRYQEYQARNMEVDLAHTKVINLSLGVLAQVHMAYLQFQDTLARYTMSRRIHRLSKQKLDLLQAQHQQEGAVSPMQLLKARVECHLEEIKHLSDLANVFVAYYRLLNTIGTDRLEQVPRSLTHTSRKKP